MRKVLLLSLLAAAAAYGGKSIEGGIASITSSSIPTTLQNRLEFYMDSASTPPVVDHVLACQGWSILWYVDRFEITDAWAVSPSASISINSNLVQPGSWFRFGRNVSGHVSNIEMWDNTGRLVRSDVITFASVSSGGPGCTIGQGGEHARTFAFLRMHSNVLPLGSKPPTIVDDANRIFEWKFDSRNNVGTLNDDVSGNAYPATVTGTTTYSTTLGLNVISVISTVGHPTWSNVISQRAGYGLALDGSQSFAQDDTSAAVTYFWQQLSGPSTLRWGAGDHTAQSPTLQGNVFGDYNMQLVVKSANGVSATSTAHIGSVAMDNNGVVVQADPRADYLFGPMIAFGKNPWAFEDMINKHAMEVRAGPDGLGSTNADGSTPSYKSLGWFGTYGHPMWLDKAMGTVAYWWNGVGDPTGHHTGVSPIGTTLAATFSPGDPKLTVADAGQLDVSTLPTIVQVHGTSTAGTIAHELVRVISVTGNDLFVDYDGRNEVCADNVGCLATPTWASGSGVHQFKISGTSTKFLTDSVAPICPLGVGLPGPAYYSTGVLSLARGDNHPVGTGTTWSREMAGASAVAGGMFLQITGTHGGGTSFVWTSRIQTWTDATHMTIARPWPSGADADLVNASYVVMKAARSVDTWYPLLVDPRGSGHASWGTRWCQSETEAYLEGGITGPSVTEGHDNGHDGTHHTGEFFSVIDDISSFMNSGSAGGISFYGEAIASRALHLRSGLQSAKNAADTIDKGWGNAPFSSPEVYGGDPLFKGGQAISSFINAILTNESGVSWPMARTWAAAGEFITKAMHDGTQNYDSRDQGYQAAWLVLAALFDPDTTTATTLPDGTPVTGYSARWRADLATLQLVDAANEQADHSWSNNAGYFAADAPNLTVTNGQATVTASGTIPSNLCTGVTTGTGTVTSGSATLTITSGTIPTGDGAHTTVVLNRCDSGTCPPTAEPSVTSSLVYRGSGSTVTLSALWPGAGTSVPVTWMAAGDSVPMMAIGSATNGYADLRRNYQCIWSNSSLMTLDRPWFATGGSGFAGTGASGHGQALFGWGQQPFMLGIKTFYMWLLARAVEITGDSSLASIESAYSGLTGYTARATQWLRDNGVDENNTGGLYYGRVFQFCEPPTLDSNIFGDSGYRTLGCAYSLGISNIVPARQLMQDIAGGYGALYTAQPNPTNLSFGDRSYGHYWGNANYDDASVASLNDHLTVAENLNQSNLLDNFLNGGKYYGQQFGMGMPWQWPAIRQGGARAASPVTVKIPFRLASISNASEVAITVTEPNGVAHAAAVCTSSPCSVAADARQGSHLYKLDYRNSSHAVIAPGDTLPLYVR